MMSKFIWVKDRDGREHYINTSQIVRVTNVPKTRSNLSIGGYAYIRVAGGEDFTLVTNESGYDTFADIVAKIQEATR